MMLLNIYTKPLVIALSITALLSACSSTSIDENEHSNSAKSEQQKLESTRKDIIDLVQVKKNAFAKASGSVDSDITINANSSNTYLEQQKIALAATAPSVIADFDRALLLMKTQQWQQANQLLDNVISVEPKLSGSYVNKAIIAMKQQHKEDALRWAEQAIAVNDGNPYAHHIKGQLARFSGDFNQAQQSYANALAIWPSFAQAHLDMAILLELYRGKLLQSRQHYQAYLVKNSNDEQAAKWLAGLEIKIARAGLEAEQPVLERGTN